MKKWISLLLGLSVFLTMVTPVYAATKESVQLEKIIAAVKTAVDIPAQFTEFEYSTYEEADEETHWSLNWYSKDTKDASQYAGRGSAYVTATSEGDILNFGLNFYDVEQKLITSLTREEGRELADAFLKKLSQPLYSTLRLTEVTNNRYAYTYYYRMYSQGIPVRGREVQVRVDKTLKRVVNYVGFAYEKLVFASPDGVIPAEDAAQAYLDKVGIKLQYASYYDYDNKKTVAFPVYRALPEKGLGIDAVTGEPVDISEILTGSEEMYDAAVEEAGSSSMNPGTGGGYQLTVQEQEKANILAGQMAANQAASKLRSAFPLLTSAYQLDQSSRYKDSKDESKYIWWLDFSAQTSDGGYYNANGTLNAKTGEIHSFYINPMTQKESLTPEQARKEADARIKTLAPLKSRNVKFSEENFAELLEWVSLNPGKSWQYTFTYTRYVNGIEYPNDRITLSYDPDCGQFVRYSLNWDDKADFPSLEKVRSKAEIFTAMDKEMDFGLQYVVFEDGKTQLVYDFLNGSPQYFNPFTGVTVNYQNKHVKDPAQTPKYTDVEGNWAQSRIEKLADNGFYIASGSKFGPNTAITQEKFMRFLLQGTGYNAERARSMTAEELYEQMVDDGIILKSEINKRGAVTKQEAAKFVVRAVGYEELAEKGELFAEPYQDIKDETYRGYFAVAKGLELLPLVSDGKIEPENKVSNAYAAYLVYQLLTRK